MTDPQRQTRRRALQQGFALGAAGLLAVPAHAVNKNAFDAKSVQDAVKALGGTALAESRDVTIQGPEIAENGATVPIDIATTLPGIRQLAVLVEKNPGTLTAVFHLTDAIEPAFAVRAKMAESSDVYAVAIARDGKAWYARRNIKVTLGGCG